MNQKLDNIPDQELVNELDKRGLDNILDKLLVKITGKDDYDHSYKQMMKLFIGCVAGFSLIILIGSLLVTFTFFNMKKTYINESERALLMNAKLDSVYNWEKLNQIEKKEKLRNQYYTIIKYYGESNITDEQILDSFNSLWLISEKFNTVNFFAPLAYIRYTSNFNPSYDSESKKGFSGLFLIDYERFSKLYNQNDPITCIPYRGVDTSKNPSDAIKILYLKMDYLYRYFCGRMDWVFFALVYNEFDVIEKYWKDGEGEIPDAFYLEGEFAEMLKCYHSFSTFEIPLKEKK